LLSARQLRRGTFRSTRSLEQAVRRYIAATNENPKPFIWTKSADDILASVQRFCERTSNSHHQPILFTLTRNVSLLEH
jgi:hypothetical protein